MTVDQLIEQLAQVSAQGMGDAQVKYGDDFAVTSVTPMTQEEVVLQ